jgi:hypothetical protein
MKIQTVPVHVCILMLIGSPFVSSAQKKDTLPLMKFPEIAEYKPSIKAGWVGQYVYELHFWDSLYHKSGKYEKRLWVRADQTMTGYIEFPTEVKGAIRVNQPDKYNATRYESWIRSGTSYTWSNINDTIKKTDLIGVMGELTVTGKREITTAFSTKGQWVKGRLSNADMQIDHTTKKYSLAPPVVSFQMEGTEWGQETYFNPAKKVPINRSVTYNGSPVSLAEIPEFFEGEFEDNQKEIIIRKRIPVTINMEVDMGSTTKLLTKKGFLDFYLVLKKAPFNNTDKANQSAVSQPVNAGTIENTSVNSNEATNTKNPEKNTIKNNRMSLRNKIKKVIGGN